MKNRVFSTTLLALLFLGGVSRLNAAVYNESGGLVIMEMENTESPLGLWEQKTALAGYTGSGYLKFDGNTFENGPPNSPLEFDFKINQSGLYYLHMRCAKEMHDGRNDVANDCYVRVEGDYNAGPAPHTSHGDNAPLSMLTSDTKYFGGSIDDWKWENGQDSSGGAGNLDAGGSSNKRVAVYDFKAGETYKLVVSGRSRYFRIDRLMFRHTSVSQSSAQNLSNPESGFVATTAEYTYDATTDFPDYLSGDVPYYIDNGNDALAIAANIESNRIGFARASRTFDGTSGSYDVTITTLTEEDGESTYRLLVNGSIVGTFENTYIGPGSPLDLQPETHTWIGIAINNGDTIAIESNADTNGEIPEGGGTAWARGRWRQIELTSSLVKPPAGRLAYVADGNSPDPDDIGANAVVFGLLSGSELQERLVHFSHSCDLVPSGSIPAADELRRQGYLHQTAGEGISHFGPFTNLATYYNCRSNQTAAVANLTAAIDASTAADPLWIIEAGEPDVIGYALQAADPAKIPFVHVVSHHPANDNSGDFFTWAQILAFGVTEHQIGDQNVGLQVLISSGLWDWAEGHSNPAMVWILDQLKYAEADGVVGFQTGKYDCSDAGMIYWWLTGANSGGNSNSTPVEIKDMLLSEAGAVPVTLYSAGADCSIKETTTTPEIEKLPDPTVDLGARGGSPWVERCTVYVFPLPDLGAVSDPFTDATFTFNYISKGGSALRGHDLYGLGRRASPMVLTNDYYTQTATLDPTDATRLQENILTDSTSVGLLSTSAGGSSNLVAYLNTQYAGGAGIGEYVFLRLNTRAPKTGISYATLTMSEGGVTGPPDTRPRIEYQAVGNSPPFISAIANQTIPVNTNTGPLAFRVSDDFTSPGSITLAKDSSNTNLVPVANIVFGGSNSNRTVTVTPAVGQVGVAEISIIADDGSLSTTNTFTLTVTPTGPSSPGVIAGWDTWVDVGGDTYNNTLTNGATGQAVGTADTSGGHPGWANWGGSATHNYGASIDGTWGTVTDNPPSTAATDSTAAVGLLNRTPSGEMTFSITNTSGFTMELTGFHFDGVRVRINTPEDWALSILAGSDVTVGAVTNGTIITDTTSPFLDREDVDIDLTGLADRTLENGEVVIFELAWTGGPGGTTAGGNNTMIDNVALTGSILPPPVPPLLDYSMSGGDLVFTWTGGGFKTQSCTNLTEGIWIDVPGGAVSPVTINPTNPAGFFRLTELD